MATLIAADLHLSRTALGLAVIAFYATSALSSGLAERLAGRILMSKRRPSSPPCYSGPQQCRR
jgi:hypothetical protein